MCSLRNSLVASLVFSLLAALGSARDAYVLLSGGGTPLTNNYSQYLQAKGVAQHLQATYPKDAVWVFFGVGNRPDQPLILADVRKQVKEKDGALIRESWVPGVLAHNRPARKAEFLTALRNEVLPTVRDGGTLYLFIGDHGELAKTDPKESVVTMWQLKTSDRPGGWETDQSELLSVTELRDVLSAGLGRGRVVFCMTQCHSGGFHYLGVPRAVLPSTDWFSAVPEWAFPTDAPPLPLVAGFTATDEESLAAGCDPDPDPDRWAGYERFVPEAWLGVELFSGKKTGNGLPAFAAAHDASVLIDQTIDKPRSSSEQFLERWATLIEKLAAESTLAPAVKSQVEAYQAAVDAGLATTASANPAFAAKRATFERYLQRMTEQNTGAAALLTDGTRAQLVEAIGPVRPPGGNAGGPGPTPPGANPAANERMKAWTDTVRPAWKAAVEAKKVKGLRGDALAFEKYLLAQEERGRNFMFPRGWQNPMLNDLYWQSGYPYPANLKRKKAEAVTRWGAERRATILAWAANAQDPAVNAAAKKLAPPRRGDGQAAAPMLPPPRTLSSKIAAERTLFYRRTLAAWAFLLAMQEEAALAQLHGLIALENTPMPATPHG